MTTRRQRKKRRKPQIQLEAAHSRPEEYITLLPYSLDEPRGPPLRELRFRISYECSLTVTDIDPQSTVEHRMAACREHGQEEDGLELAGEMSFRAELQRKLLSFVLAEPAILEKYVRNTMGELLIEEVRDTLLTDGGEFEILAPAIATLSPDEREFLEKAEAHGTFSERTEQFKDALGMSDTILTFEEVKNRL